MTETQLIGATMVALEVIGARAGRARAEVLVDVALGLRQPGSPRMEVRASDGTPLDRPAEFLDGSGARPAAYRGIGAEG